MSAPGTRGVTGEVGAHLQKAARKLEGSKVLLREGFPDDSASRSYYAVFHAVVAALLSRGADLSKHKHAFILKQFRSQFIDTGELPSNLYSKILRVKADRESADYSVKFWVTKEDASALLEDAKEVVGAISEYLEGDLELGGPNT
ncbi:MAG: HEPN domain-containing protein [Promethearchaeota archaeon]